MLNNLDALGSKNPEKERYIRVCTCVCVCVLGRVLSVHISFLEMPSLVVLWILPSFAVS